MALIRRRRYVERLTQIELNHPIGGTCSTDAFRVQANMEADPMKKFAITSAGLLIPHRKSKVHVDTSTENPVQDGADWAEVSNFPCRGPVCLSYE